MAQHPVEGRAGGGRPRPSAGASRRRSCRKQAPHGGANGPVQGSHCRLPCRSTSRSCACQGEDLGGRWWTRGARGVRALTPEAGHCHSRWVYLVSEGRDETRGTAMNIFLAGASGVLGRALVPQLVARGHTRLRRYSPRVHELHRPSGDHLEAVLAFELENRAYFARSINDRGDGVYETFSGHHDAFLAEQDAGVCAFYVLLDRDGSIVGRFNLYDLDGGATRVGYRVAEQVAGRGVATEALRDLCRMAATDHGLRVPSAESSRANIASQRVLEKAGFTVTGSCVVDGDPGLNFTLAFTHEPT